MPGAPVFSLLTTSMGHQETPLAWVTSLDHWNGAPVCATTVDTGDHRSLAWATGMDHLHGSLT